MADRPFVRVYHADLIRDYPHIWDDDAALAAWLRLLVVADGSWPAPAELPRSLKDRALTSLQKSGLLTMVGLHRFSIKGMDAERTQRQDAARNAAAKRWHSGSESAGIKRGNAPPMPSRAEPSHTEPSSGAPASNDPYDDAEGEALTWLARHGCDVRPGNGYHAKLVTAVQAHGINAVVGMFDRLASAGMKSGDTKGYVFGAIDALNARTRPNIGELEAEEREEERRASFAERAAATRRKNAEIIEALEKGHPV